jgi:hypothetical protein
MWLEKQQRDISLVKRVREIGCQKQAEGTTLYYLQDGRCLCESAGHCLFCNRYIASQNFNLFLVVASFEP